MIRILEWLGGVMFLIALLDFVPSPRKAIESIDAVLRTNPVHIQR